MEELRIKDTESKFIKRVSSKEYLTAFTNILIFEKVLKKLFSDFVYKNAKQNLFYFLKI